MKSSTAKLKASHSLIHWAPCGVCEGCNIFLPPNFFWQNGMILWFYFFSLWCIHFQPVGNTIKIMTCNQHFYNQPKQDTSIIVATSTHPSIHPTTPNVLPVTWICLAIERRRRWTCWSSMSASSIHTVAMMDRIVGMFALPSPRIWELLLK